MCVKKRRHAARDPGDHTSRGLAIVHAVQVRVLTQIPLCGSFHQWRCFTAAIRAETNVAGSIGLAMWALKPAANDFARSS
jgi:hypothetical protein